jgi:hypothetical protein
MKAYRLLIILLVVIIAVPLTGRLFWLMKKRKSLDIVIINKSVQKSSENEVKSLNWTLNFEKFENKEGDLYNFQTDYFGYFPDAISENTKIKTYRLEEISSIAENNDALFFLDNSGTDLVQTEKKAIKKIAYGGFNQNDYFLLKEMIGRQKLVIAEYNFISPPTEDLVHYNVEQLLDIYSLGWSGKFFNDLSKENISGLISNAWFEHFKQNYSTEWAFRGPGIVLLNSSQNRIIVLPAKKFMNTEFPDVVTVPEIALEYNIPQKVSFTGWFDIAFQGENKVISRFNLNLNQEGNDILRLNGIEPEFPAVIESANKKFYYMAGDYSKSNVCLSTSRLGFLSDLIREMGKSKIQNPDKFYQVYSDFLIARILNNYYSEISGKPNK